MHVDISVPGMLLDAQRAYNDEMYQNLMAIAAQMQVLGILAGVVDGPTEEYRAAVAEAAGTYFSGLLTRSQRQHWYEGGSLLDVGATALGLWYEGLGRATSWAVPEDWETVRGVADGWTSTGETLQTTDPDKFLANLATDFLKSIWNDCLARYNEFWADVEAEGMLSALAQLKADADLLAAEIAIDVALTIATGGAAAAVRIVARRLSKTVSRVVIRLVDVATDAIPDSNVLKRIDLPDADIDPSIKRQVLDEENLRTRSSREDLTERADVPNPETERPSGGSNGDAPEADRSVFRHPRDGDPPRSRDQLLRDGEVPDQNEFNDWFNDLSPQELDNLWAEGELQGVIKRRLLNGGKKHEWLMRSRAPQLKRLGFSAEEILDFTSPTATLSGPNPTVPGTRWRHSPEGGGRGSGPGSGTMHKRLGELIDNAASRDDLLRDLGDFAEDWLDNGVDSFPPTLRDAIRGAGG